RASLSSLSVNISSMVKATILMAEDAPEFRRIYKDRLAVEGYHILEAADGEEALNLLHQHPVNLVMTDINMPHKDGFALLDAMKSDPSLKKVPVVVMSVFGEGEYTERAYQKGAADYLIKGMKTPN